MSRTLCTENYFCKSYSWQHNCRVPTLGMHTALHPQPCWNAPATYDIRLLVRSCLQLYSIVIKYLSQHLDSITHPSALLPQF